ncbi:hypothetical protein K443DRAFT_681186 [Laccaria amethystina LaAM-08-1]|uniref:Uncharacterized protein n=1 Tax=Laccaria amethystina LaAM-08-1 TaxID=1095629 RepID=A0A0C9XPH6_9AGAR|nr:hypothetical protein K443DRAFT_681186 [Laccaria amethystina LaAM-08-1]
MFKVRKEEEIERFCSITIQGFLGRHEQVLDVHVVKFGALPICAKSRDIRGQAQTC